MKFLEGLRNRKIKISCKLHPFMACFFIYNLEKNKEIIVDKKNIFGNMGFYGIRYYKTDSGVLVEIGDGYRHEIFIKAKYWNKILEIIKDDKLDKEGINAIVKGLMHTAIQDEFYDKFIDAIKSGKIKKIKK